MLLLTNVSVSSQTGEVNRASAGLAQTKNKNGGGQTEDFS
jgi:hypothetical protein